MSTDRIKEVYQLDIKKLHLGLQLQIMVSSFHYEYEHELTEFQNYCEFCPQE